MKPKRALRRVAVTALLGALAYDAATVLLRGDPISAVVVSIAATILAFIAVWIAS